MTKGRKELVNYVASFYANDYISPELSNELKQLYRSKGMTPKKGSIYPDFFNYELETRVIEESIEDLYQIAKRKQTIFVHSLFGWAEPLYKLLNEAGESEVRELVRDWMLVEYGFTSIKNVEFGHFLETEGLTK